MHLVKIKESENSIIERYINFDFLVEVSSWCGKCTELRFSETCPYYVEGDIDEVVKIINHADEKHYLVKYNRNRR